MRSANLEFETKTKIIVDDLNMDYAAVARARRSQQPLALLRKQFVNNINVNISVGTLKCDHENLFKIEEDDEASSIKKSAASNTHSRMSSKNSKDMGLAKMKPISEKKAQIYPASNPIQEVDNDYNENDPEAPIRPETPLQTDRATSQEANSAKEAAEAKLSTVGSQLEEKFFSQLPLSNKFRSKIKTKFNKSFNAKPMTTVKKNSVKNSIIPTRPENLSVSFKASPGEKAREIIEKLPLRTQPQHQHVHRLISNMKNGSLHLRRELGEYESSRPDPTPTKFSVSKFGQTLPLSPYKADQTLRKDKVANHRRAYSDAESANYGTNKNKSQLSSLARQLLPHSPGENREHAQTSSSKLQRITDLLENNVKFSKLSFRSAFQPKRESQPEPIESVPKLVSTDFLKRQPAKKTFTVIPQLEAAEAEIARLKEENLDLRHELAKRDEVQTGNPDNRRTG